MRKRYIDTGFLLLLLLTISNMAFSQCGPVVKKTLPKLLPYQFDGQAEYKIEEGKSIELVSTFSAGGQYRIMYCPPEQWRGNGIFRIYERKTRRLLFSNQIDKDYQHWDFKSKATQDYIIEIIIPPASVGESPRKGCVAILIGSKNS